MSIVTLSAAGRLTPAEAWERYADISRWQEWAPQITGVEASEQRLSFGMTGRVHGPLRTSVDFVVDGVDEDAMTWSWTVQRRPVRLHLEHSVSRQGGGSSAALRIEGLLPVVLAYAPMAQLALHCLVSRQPRPSVDGAKPGADLVTGIYADPKDDPAARDDPDIPQTQVEGS